MADRGRRIPAMFTDEGEVMVHAASSFVISTASPSLRTISRPPRLPTVVPVRVMQR